MAGSRQAPALHRHFVPAALCHYDNLPFPPHAPSYHISLWASTLAPPNFFEQPIIQLGSIQFHLYSALHGGLSQRRFTEQQKGRKNIKY